MIINAAITSVYRVIAVWMPVTVVPRSSATVAIDTFITDASRIITNCAAVSVSSTAFAALAWLSTATLASVTPHPQLPARNTLRKSSASPLGPLPSLAIVTAR